jgi:DNA (cytosine-5)-methyltransferase 1
MRIKIPSMTIRGFLYVCEGGAFDMSYPSSKTRRGRVQGGGNLCPTLMAGESEIVIFEGYVED